MSHFLFKLLINKPNIQKKKTFEKCLDLKFLNSFFNTKILIFLKTNGVILKNAQ
jgi:hypothetical protein